MKGYPRKTCKKAKAASMSMFCDGDDGLGALSEGVGGETCYPAIHKMRRAGRGVCGEPQVGDARDVQIVSSNARRALQAALILESSRRSPPSSMCGKQFADGKPMYEYDQEDHLLLKPVSLAGLDIDEVTGKMAEDKLGVEDKKRRKHAKSVCAESRAASRGCGLWDQLRATCCFRASRTPCA